MLTFFSRTFSTMTVKSFHNDSRHFLPFMLILFHATTRSHSSGFVIKSEKLDRLVRGKDWQVSSAALVAIIIAEHLRADSIL